jgi:hypothetical protein
MRVALPKLLSLQGHAFSLHILRPGAGFSLFKTLFGPFVQCPRMASLIRILDQGTRPTVARLCLLSPPNRVNYYGADRAHCRFVHCLYHRTPSFAILFPGEECPDPMYHLLDWWVWLNEDEE